MTDRRTDGQTDGQTVFSSLDRVCISCSAVKTVYHSTNCKLKKRSLIKKGLIIKLKLAAVTDYWTHEALSLSLFIGGAYGFCIHVNVFYLDVASE